MTLAEAQTALQAAQQEHEAAKAARNKAMLGEDRRAIADTDAKYDVACEKLREAREAFIAAGLGDG